MMNRADIKETIRFLTEGCAEDEVAFCDIKQDNQIFLFHSEQDLHDGMEEYRNNSIGNMYILTNGIKIPSNLSPDVLYVPKARNLKEGEGREFYYDYFTDLIIALIGFRK